MGWFLWIFDGSWLLICEAFGNLLNSDKGRGYGIATGDLASHWDTGQNNAMWYHGRELDWEIGRLCCINFYPKCVAHIWSQVALGLFHLKLSGGGGGMERFLPPSHFIFFGEHILCPLLAAQSQIKAITIPSVPLPNMCNKFYRPLMLQFDRER